MTPLSSFSFPKNKKIVIFSPHPDDDVIGVGGTIQKLRENFNKIWSVYITNGVSNRKSIKRDISINEKQNIRINEAKESSEILNIEPVFLNLDYFNGLEYNSKNINKIQSLIVELEPEIIILPNKYELHPTHQISTRLILDSIKFIESGKIKELWFYEITSTLKAPNKIITFDEEIMSKKIKSICAHKSQIERKRYDLATKGLNIFRGINSNAINKNEFGTFGDIQYGEGFYIKIIN